MRFAPTEEQAEFRSAVKALLVDTCDIAAVRASWGGEVGRHTEVGQGNGRVERAWKGLADMGVLGLLVPEADGGMGMTQDAFVGIAVEAGYAGLPDPLIETAAVAPPVLASSSEPLASELLARIASGEVTVGVGFGESPLVPCASTADWFLILTGTAAHLLDASAVDITPLSSVDGARHLGRVNWSTAASTVLVSSDSDAAVLTAARNAAVTFSSATLVGLSHRMIDMTVEYVGERHQFGVPIGSFQAVKHELADAALGVEFAEPLAFNAAHLLSVGEDATVAASMAKSRASRASQVASDACLQLHGAIGYTVEHDLHLFMKRAWALSRQYGDFRSHRAVVRRALLGS